MIQRIAFVTGNEGKLRELVQLVGRDIEVLHVRAELEEIQGTTEEVVLDKVRRAAVHADGGPVVVEDMGLACHALGGMPGPYVKAFVDAVGPEGIARMLDGFDDRRATDVCAYALWAGYDKDPVIFMGRTEGRIVLHSRGANGFGWDSIFTPDGAPDGKTYAEMEPSEKATFSARSKALDRMLEFIGPK